MALALVVPPWRTLAYCLAVLGTNLAGHVVAGDLGETHPVNILGLWIGFPLWLMAITIVTDRLAGHVLRVNVPPGSEARPEPPRRVPAWSPEPPSEPPAPSAADVAVVVAADDREEPAPAVPDPPAATTRRLTARQLQVVALVADGLRHREVAACLSISERQVQRHIAEAVARLGLRNAYELAAVAVSEGIVPDAAAHAARG
jgi:DNA-binding CsgD family transcriptional regulator